MRQAKKRVAGAEAGEPPAEMKNGAAFKFPPPLYKKTCEKLLLFLGRPGFGPRTAAMVATSVLGESLKGVDVGVSPPWEPSYSWCLWFLNTILGMSYRRVTGKLTSLVSTDKQILLWNMLLDTLALDIAIRKVLPSLIIGSDEFGLNFFPQNEMAWSHRGASGVLVDVYGEMRQYTANISHTAMGVLGPFQIIFPGKTVRSLPETVKADSQYYLPATKGWVCGTTENHWSNLSEKKKLINAFARYRREILDGFVRVGAMTQLESETMPMVALLDCWPVNLSAEFRSWVAETHPYILLRYIPAGGTGTWQINDTFFHGPYKTWIRQQAEEWYNIEMGKILAKYNASKVIQDGSEEDRLATLQITVNRLMSLPVLRERAVEWNIAALAKLTAVDAESGRNLIQKGWNGDYKVIFDEAFHRAAKLRADAIRLQEERMNDVVNEVALEEARGGVHAEPAVPTAYKKKRGKKRGIVVLEPAVAGADLQPDLAAAQLERSLAQLQQEAVEVVDADADALVMEEELVAGADTPADGVLAGARPPPHAFDVIEYTQERDLPWLWNNYCIAAGQGARGASKKLDIVRACMEGLLSQAQEDDAEGEKATLFKSYIATIDKAVVEGTLHELIADTSLPWHH